jgi:hypothetical protein
VNGSEDMSVKPIQFCKGDIAQRVDYPENGFKPLHRSVLG